MQYTIWSTRAAVSSATDYRVFSHLFTAMVWSPEISSLFQVPPMRWFLIVTIPSQSFVFLIYYHNETFYACQLCSKFCSGKTIALAYCLTQFVVYLLSGFLYYMFGKTLKQSEFSVDKLFSQLNLLCLPIMFTILLWQNNYVRILPA